MRVVLLGAGGMLARELAAVFSDAELACWTKQDCDITDTVSVGKKIAKARPALILNAAAYTNVDACEKDERRAAAINAVAVGHLADSAESVGATLVHFSTDYVFDGQAVDGYREDDPPAPLNAYGRTKAQGEQLLVTSGADWYLIRTAWLFGQHGKNFVETMLTLARRQQEILVVHDQRGSPTSARDLAVAVRALIDRGESFGIYHRTNAGAATWFEFASEIFRQSGLTVKLRPVSSAEFPRPAKRPAVSLLQTTKLPPLRPWQDALAEYLKERITA